MTKKENLNTVELHIWNLKHLPSIRQLRKRKERKGKELPPSREPRQITLQTSPPHLTNLREAIH